MDKEIKCRHCGWLGYESLLLIVHDDSSMKHGEEVCPECDEIYNRRREE